MHITIRLLSKRRSARSATDRPYTDTETFSISLGLKFTQTQTNTAPHKNETRNALCISGSFFFVITSDEAVGTPLAPSVELAIFSDVFCLGGGEDVGCGGVFLFDPSHEIIDGGVEIIGQSSKGENIRLDIMVFILVYRLLADSDNTCKLLLTDPFFGAQFL